jgi:hypothetical protein
MNWSAFSDKLLIDALTARGYVVRHKSEARRSLSWNRTEPMPGDVIFEDEAVKKIREQIDTSLIEFRIDPGDGEFSPTIRRATLRVI